MTLEKLRREEISKPEDTVMGKQLKAEDDGSDFDPMREAINKEYDARVKEITDAVSGSLEFSLDQKKKLEEAGKVRLKALAELKDKK